MIFVQYKVQNTKMPTQPQQSPLMEVLPLIAPYLTFDSIQSLKLTNRQCYYHFISAQLWISMKLTIAQQKLEYMDWQFQEQEKVMTKRDRGIRIHSLKKQVMLGQEGTKGKREPSNIKQKGKALKISNELLFRNTEIGFKRLLKNNGKKKEGEYDFRGMVQLPLIDNLGAYAINIKDPWSVNMDKANKLAQFFKKVNDFHNKFLSELKLPTKDLLTLSAKLTQCEQRCQTYTSFIGNKIHEQIIKSVEGAQKNLLIDEQLNKVCRLFWNYHSCMIGICRQIGPAKILVQNQSKNNGSSTNNMYLSMEFIEMLNSFDESVQALSSFCEGNQELGKLLTPQLTQILFSRTEQLEQANIIFEQSDEQIRIETISWNTLASKPLFSETVFQIMVSVCGRLIKTVGKLCPDDISVSITLTKIKNTKHICQSLLNISKYFTKLSKQLQQKNKKPKQSKGSAEIRQFMCGYQGKKQQLFLVKTPVKIDQIVLEFKDSIGALKEKLLG